jgi:transposase
MDIDALRGKFSNMWPLLNERQRRHYAASEALALGHGGITLVSDICGLSRVTITKGINELGDKNFFDGRLRMPGAGRPSLVSIDSTLVDDLTDILEETTRGDPESLLCWTCLSTRNIAEVLNKMGHSVGHVYISYLLKEQGYSLQSNRKVEEGRQHNDRNEQFQFINTLCKRALNAGQPVLSVDTKKKEIIGNFKNAGQKYMPKYNPEKVNVHDFPDPLVPKAIPYGIYDVGQNKGFVNIGIDHDTSTFAVASIRGWWNYVGKKFYPNIKYLVITADGGGSNGYRVKLWKVEIQNLSNFIGIPIHVSHFPPGTSKWNKVEHRLFSFISTNWKGQPLRDYETVVSYISHTTTMAGLKVICKLDRRKYSTGVAVTKDEMNNLNLLPSKFHGEWNYTIKPSKK